MHDWGHCGRPIFYAANVSSGKVEAYDASFKPTLTTAFANPAATTAGLVAYNVQMFGGKLYVTYGKPNAAKNNVVNGAGNGAVAVFDFSGNLIANLVAGGALNSPWGVVLAPSTWGPFAGSLLVGNFGDGTINAYNATTGAVVGTLKDTAGNPVTIPGLWSLTVGSGAQSEDPGTVYFTAGIGGGPNGTGTTTDPIQSHGLLGSIQPAPVFLATGNLTFLTFNNPSLSVPTGILNGGSLVAGPLAPNTWMTIKGADLAPITALWQVTGTTLPTTLSVECFGDNRWRAGLRRIHRKPADQLPDPLRSEAGQHSEGCCDEQWFGKHSGHQLGNTGIAGVLHDWRGRTRTELYRRNTRRWFVDRSDGA